MLDGYASLIKAVLGAVLACFLVVGGCRYGTKGSAAEIATLEAQVSSLLSTTQKWEEIDKENKENIKRALKASADWKKRADKAAGDVAKERDRASKAEVAKRQALAEARKDPSCAELLRRQVCSIVPLP